MRPLTSAATGEACAWGDEGSAVKKERWAEGAVVKDRAEPCHIAHVAQVVGGAMGVDEARLAAAAHANSVRLFGLQAADH